MTKTKNKVNQLLLVLLLTCTASLVNAQGPGDPGGDPDPGTNVPFDSGLSLVIAAGIAYASKKGYDKRRKTKQDQSEK